MSSNTKSKSSEIFRFELKPKQQKAMELLIMGEKNYQQIADEIGVSDKTLRNWRRHDEEFRKAYDHLSRERYRDIAPEAISKLITIMRKADFDTARKAAEKLIQLAGHEVLQLAVGEMKEPVILDDINTIKVRNEK